MTNRDKVLNYLRNIAPQGATNSEIGSAIGIQPHQQVFQITQALHETGFIKGVRHGRTWHWYAGETLEETQASEKPESDVIVPPVGSLTPRQFEQLARQVMSNHFGVPLLEREVISVGKRFDMVSADGNSIGDAKYFTMVQGERLPSAKFSVIAEYMWFLEKTGAPNIFIVFGHDRRVPEIWLQKYGRLVENVKVFFLDDEGRLTQMNDKNDE